MHEHLGTSKENCLTSKNPIFKMKCKQWTENETEIPMKTFQASAYAYLERKELNQLAESFNVSKKGIENWFSAKHHTLYQAAEECCLKVSNAQ